MFKKTNLILIAVVLAGGCATGGSGTSSAAADDANPAATGAAELPPEKRPYAGPTKIVPSKPDMAALSFGRGLAANDEITVTFRFSVTEYASGKIEGWFEHSADLAAGTIDIRAEVTCAVLDSSAQRAWVGGKVVRNGSTNPLYAGAPGADIWFSAAAPVAEIGNGAITMPVLRDKELGSASEFCSRKPWDSDGMLTVRQGALGVFTEDQATR